MNCTSSVEFVNTSAKKIDKISRKYDPRFCQEKDLPSLIHAAGIDLTDSEGAAFNLLDCAGLHNEQENAQPCGCDKIPVGDFRRILIGDMKVPMAGDGEQGGGPILRRKGRVFYGGIDGGTTVSVEGSPVHPSVWRELEEALDESRKTRKPVCRPVCGFHCMVSPAPGGGSVSYAVRLEFGGVVVLLHRNPNGNIPVAKIIYGWNVCDRYDMESIEKRVFFFLSLLGVERERTWFTRLDTQVTAGMPMDAFYASVTQGNYRCRQTKPRFHLDGLLPEGIYFGTHKSPVLLRIYDKWAEAFGNSEEKCNALIERFEAGDYDAWREPVTRFEFEAHRPVLKSLGIENFSDLRKNGMGYVTYLCNWFRPVVEKFGRHSEREEVLPEWQEVAGMFGTLFCDGPALLTRKAPRHGGQMSQTQRDRTYATVCTLIRKLLLHDSQSNGTKPGVEFNSIVQQIFGDIREDVEREHLALLVNSDNYLDKIVENFDAIEEVRRGNT